MRQLLFVDALQGQLVPDWHVSAFESLVTVSGTRRGIALLSSVSAHAVLARGFHVARRACLEDDGFPGVGGMRSNLNEREPAAGNQGNLHDSLSADVEWLRRGLDGERAGTGDTRATALSEAVGTADWKALKQQSEQVTAVPQLPVGEAHH